MYHQGARKAREKKARLSELCSNVLPMLCSCLRRPCYLRGALTCKSTNVFGITNPDWLPPSTHQHYTYRREAQGPECAAIRENLNNRTEYSTPLCDATNLFAPLA